MANRPVFVAIERAPFYRAIVTEFEWSGGFALSQSRKNIAALHASFKRRSVGKNVLEISSKSPDEIGVNASAFNLMKLVPSMGRSVPMECIFQSSKVFASAGPFPELLTASPRDAKRDPRIAGGGRLRAFRFEGVEYPLTSDVGFYDYIYINALLENPEIAAKLQEYDAFTDIVFNPEKSRNCQARSAAIYVSLQRLGKLDALSSFESFIKEVNESFTMPAEQPPVPKEPEPEAVVTEAPRKLSLGDVVDHKAFGRGTVTELGSTTVKVTFETVGVKALGIDWVKKNCEINA